PRRRRTHETGVERSTDRQRNGPLRAGLAGESHPLVHRVFIPRDHDLPGAVEVRWLHDAMRRGRTADAADGLGIAARYRGHGRPPARGGLLHELAAAAPSYECILVA